MRKLFTTFLMLAALTLGQAQAGTLAQVNAAQFQLNRVTSETAFRNQLGRIVMKNEKRVEKCVYDIAVNGSISAGTGNLRNVDGGSCVIPKSAVVWSVLIDVLSTGVSSTGANMALNLQTAGDIKAALIATSYTGLVAGIPVGTAASAIKLTADRTLTYTNSIGFFSAGKWNVLVEYMMSE